MKLKELCSRKDLYAGLSFIIFGIVAVIEARNYPMGTVAYMGPGYIPYCLGVILVLLGLIISVRSLWLIGEAIEPFVLRSMLLVTIAVLAFIYLAVHLGLVLATLALVVISSFTSGEFNRRKVVELVVLYLVLVAMGLGLFVYIIKIPLRAWP